MTTSNRRRLAAVCATVLVAALSISPVSPISQVATRASAADFTGDFDSGTFDVWDGVSYDFSWFDPALDSYVITSAAQLASLSILTNNLTDEDYTTFRTALPANCTPYLTDKYDFTDKTITLDVDVDLGSHDWLPISYPFDTPNPTRDDFDALSHVPAYLTSVDPWVGDGNGNNIITRYLEYPESEMRFRDLLYYANSDDSVNELIDCSYTGDYDYIGYNTYYHGYVPTMIGSMRGSDLGELTNGYKSMPNSACDPRLWMRFINGLQLHNLNYTEEVNVVGGGTTAIPVAESYISDYHGDVNIPIVKLKTTTSDNALQSYVYKDVHSGGAINRGFNGIFEGNSHRIKGLHPVTPWTNDTLERLTTFDPIAKGLFSTLDTSGEICNLNVKGYYDSNDVCSYSAILCAYNYGLIKGCYVYGDMEQGLITMRYPVTRDYGQYAADGTIITPSVYTLSDAAGTVLPVGNSGFVTAFNAGSGVIEGCKSAGNVTQAFRQFGFITCTNNGTIKGGCLNTADFSTHAIEIDFRTDEWDYYAYYPNDRYLVRNYEGRDYTSKVGGGNPDVIQSDYPLTGARLSSKNALTYDGGNDLRNKFITAYGGYGFFRYRAANPSLSSFHSVDSQGTEKINKMIAYAEAQGLSPQWGTESIEDWLRVIWPYGVNVAEAACFYPAASLPGYYQGSTPSGAVWVAPLYNTEEGESVAANHLFGIYGMTAVGGICVINNGVIDNAENAGAITSILNTSPRYNCALSNAAGNYNYIRPTNSFGMFSTQTATAMYASGVCVINNATIRNSKNSGNITNTTYSIYTTYVTDSLFGMLAYTDNHFYRTGCIAQYDEGIANKEFYPLSFNWWWDFLEDDSTGSVTSGTDGRSTGKVTARGSSKDIVKIVTEYPEYDWTWSEGSARRTDATTGELVTSIHIDQKDNPDRVALDSNMPYPLYAKAFLLDTEPSSYRYSLNGITLDTNLELAAGVALYNFSQMYDVENTGVATFGICCMSDGLDDTAIIEGVKQNGVGCKENVGYYLLNTSVENGEIHNPVGSSYGIARYVRSTNGLSPKQKQISVYEGISGYERIESDDARIPVSNIFLYDTVHNGDTVAREAVNVDFKDIVNFQESENGLSNKLTNCNLENIWVYNDVVYNGIGVGTIQSYMRNVNFFGHSAGSYALGDFSGGAYTDLTVNMINTSGELGTAKYLLKAKDATIDNLLAFLKLSSTGLELINCTANEVLEYADTPDLGTSASYYVNNMQDTVLSNALLECKINLTELDPMSLSYANLPGTLKAAGDASTFENVVVQTPNSCVSYPSFNFSSRVDKTIATDAYLDKDTNARASGAMAYWADHGNQPDRTFNYTVATADTMDIMPEACLSIIEPDFTELDSNNIISLPIYTRRKKSSNEESTRRVLIPYTSKGAGEIKGTYTDGTLTSETNCLQAMFPQTSMYVPVGAPYTLRVYEQPGFGLLHLYETSDSVETHEIEFQRNTDMQFIMPDEDVTYTSVWTYCYDIYKDVVPGVTITTSADASVPGETIDISTVCDLDNYEISSVYYADYKQDSDNRWVITTTTHEIPLDTMSFVMPEHPVKIFVKLSSTDCVVTQFILAGTAGIIDNVNRTINVYLNDVSTDVTSIYPTMFTSTAVEISPNWQEARDYTKPVKFLLTCENGDVKEYTVNVVHAVDGQIGRFEILGYTGVIDQEAGIISVALPVEMNLTSVLPSIVWNGSKITPTGYVDLSSMSAEYTVTSSTGVDKTYTVTLTYPDTSKVISDFKLVDTSGTAIELTVDDDTNVITAYIPYGFDTENCTVSSFKYTGLSASIKEGAALNLLTLTNITISDYEDNTLVYKFVVSELPSTQKAIVQFKLYGYSGVIDEENGTITVSIPSYYDLRDIIPDAVLFVGKDITEDYYAAHNWLVDNVSFTVNAYDGSSKVYNIVVRQTEA